MRRFFLLFLLCLLSVPTLANEDNIPMPDLPDEPILVPSIWDLSWPEAYQIVWLDNQTVVINFDATGNSADRGNRTYSYDVSSANLLELEESLFVADWDEEQVAFFQSGNHAVHRSPFPNEDGIISMIYESDLHIECGTECIGTLILYGYYQVHDENTIVYREGTYRAMPVPAQTGINVHWSRDNKVLLMEMGNNYSPDISLHHLDLQTGETSRLPFYLLDWNKDHVFGLSPDGQRVLLATEVYTENRDYAPERWQKLLIWDAPRHDDACACTYDPVSHVVYSETNNEGHNFAGAGFVDEDTILYIGNEGMYRHTISTGESVLLDAAFNTHWINLAIFSPDNRHVAVATEQGLYVLPTGYEG